ncbi:hypothetical protein MMC27_000879 [Xylographa pallens]|nr:hypothetical protein [Xylographa pallens]
MFFNVALALVIPVALSILPFASCQVNQFTFPVPRKVGDAAIAFQVGNSYNIEWETTATSYYLSVASEERGLYSQTYGINNPDGSQVTSPRSFYVGTNFNVSLGGFFFFLSLPGGDDNILFESDNFYPVTSGTASPAQLNSAGVKVATVLINGGSSAAASSTITPSTTFSTATTMTTTTTTQPATTTSGLATSSTLLSTSLTATPSASATSTATPAAGTNNLAIGLGVGLGVPLALTLLIVANSVVRHRRRALHLSQNGNASDGPWTRGMQGDGIDPVTYTELHTEDAYEEMDAEARRVELESHTRAVEAGGRPIVEM